VANLFYRNNNVKITCEVFDQSNNPVGLSTTSGIYWYIKTPDNLILSNDPNISNTGFANGTGIYTSIPQVQTQATGIYYINYVLTKVGEYKYKFQVVDNPTQVNVAGAGDIKVIDDGIF